MEERKPVSPSSSPSSLASELFGSKDTYPSASSTGIFGSIFGPPSNPKIVGKELLRSEGDKKGEFSGEHWSKRSGNTAADDTTKSSNGAIQNAPNKDMSSVYQDQKVQPCHLSSSIYYGGQENYSQPQNTQAPSMNSFKKDSGEDDSGTASRGNWWQGSLYY